MYTLVYNHVDWRTSPIMKITNSFPLSMSFFWQNGAWDFGCFVLFVSYILWRRNRRGCHVANKPDRSVCSSRRMGWMTFPFWIWLTVSWLFGNLFRGLGHGSILPGISLWLILVLGSLTIEYCIAARDRRKKKFDKSPCSDNFVVCNWLETPTRLQFNIR